MKIWPVVVGTAMGAVMGCTWPYRFEVFKNALRGKPLQPLGDWAAVREDFEAVLGKAREHALQDELRWRCACRFNPEAPTGTLGPDSECEYHARLRVTKPGEKPPSSGLRIRSAKPSK